MTNNTYVLSPEEIREIQSTNGELSCYGRMNDNTIIVATNDMSAQKTKATKNTKTKLE